MAYSTALLKFPALLEIVLVALKTTGLDYITDQEGFVSPRTYSLRAESHFRSCKF